MSTPLVSCIVPVYIGERYLAETLTSIVAQTYSPIEIIFVDDGSTDGTEGVVGQFGPAVRLVRQENAGTPTARNTGILQSQGDFIGFLGADDDALGALYDHHRQMVYRTALMITGDNQAADDLLQDVFLRLYRFAGNFDADRPLEPWLYRMTTNLAYDWVKRRRGLVSSLEDLADWLISSGKNTPYEAVEKQDEWAQVQMAVSSLPLNQRVEVVLYYLNDLSIQDISEILEVPVGTVKSRLHYGRLALKRKLGFTQELVPDLSYERS